MNPIVEAVTADLIERSRTRRQQYLDRMQRSMEETPPKKRLSCGNLAHAIAACSAHEKQNITEQSLPMIASDKGNSGGLPSVNLGITTAYNDMLSAHQPYKNYPDQIKQRAALLGSTAQIAGGVPAMCDGVTQGQAGMELSLFSRDVIAMATAIGLSHNMFDGNLFLGICDKIVPGMLMGALEFGHLPAVFVPAGPMPSGLPNKEKAAQRQLYAEGKIDQKAMLEVESASYHSPGTCTFYGTANSNQMLMEMMGLQLPGSSFEAPTSAIRPALTNAAVDKLIDSTLEANYRPLSKVFTEQSLINALIGLLATGGSTNHSLHLIAIGRVAGIDLQWSDMDRLSKVIPLLARVYPNGQADVNHFHQAGGMGYIVYELRRAGLLNEDVTNIMGQGLASYELSPELVTDDSSQTSSIAWTRTNNSSGDLDILRPVSEPFDAEGGLSLLDGNLGKAVIKASAVAEEHRVIEGPAYVIETQDQLKVAFDAGELDRDVVVVARFQGPSANGMPELHKLTPPLGVLQDRGYKVALVTDGRMSGASGKVPAAIHLSPEAHSGGLIGKIQNGDMIKLNANTGELSLQVSEAELNQREQAQLQPIEQNIGRGLFAGLRQNVSVAELGASVFEAS